MAIAGIDWIALFSAALGGGLTVKLIEIGHDEFQRWRTRRDVDGKTVDRSLEPLLRATDELFGKLRSLVEQDFVPLRDVVKDGLDDESFASVVYLFVQFWSEVEIVRQRGLSTEVARSKRGRSTQAFLRCLESRKLRLIDRISQRAIGESALVDGRTMNFVEYVRHYDGDAHSRRWVSGLIDLLSTTQATDTRQAILQYAVVLHSMIDTLDPEHLVTRDRPATPNKLTAKSWKDLNYRVFKIYLPDVKHSQKYIGPPKRRP
ncbi:MAG: hypothetical protein K2W86_18130 [Sphingomonas sp.]|uniref:hypothetical protein n=1 Tax=Sphingomonas sp. TaxID=28214 RepID=UPI0035A93822|nr:hypothetical protein [Sphingomonas sp.]